MNETDSYRQIVEKLSKSSSSEVFSNGKAAHAAIIFESFFSHAKNRVLIFCNNLSPDVFGLPGVLQKMEMALLRGVKIVMIVQEKPECIQLFDLIQGWKKKDLKVTLEVATNYADIHESKENFAVMDGKAFRFEPDKSEPKAFASMNLPEIAKNLETIFYKRLAAIV